MYSEHYRDDHYAIYFDDESGDYVVRYKSAEIARVESLRAGLDVIEARKQGAK